MNACVAMGIGHGSHRFGIQNSFPARKGCDMAKSYSPGSDADAIIERQVAKGNFATANAAIEAGVQMLEEREVELAELRGLIDDGDADVETGRVHRYATADALLADIVPKRRTRSARKR